MRKKKDRLFGVVDVSDGQTRMVFGEVDDGVFAGDVCGGDDGEFMPGNGRVKSDGGDPSPWDGAADRGSEPHAWERDVVDIPGAAKDLPSALLAGGRLTDDLECFGHRGSVKNRTKAVRREVLISTVLWRVSVQWHVLA